MGCIRVGPSKKVSSCSFLRTQRTLPLNRFLEKKEGYFGVGFFLSPLSPPLHGPIRHPHSTTTPHPYHSLQPPVAPRCYLLSQSREQGEHPQVGFFLAGNRKKEGTPSKISFWWEGGKKAGYFQNRLLRKKGTMELVSSRTKVLSEDRGQANQTPLH